jgi:hypothetical protein
MIHGVVYIAYTVQWKDVAPLTDSPPYPHVTDLYPVMQYGD